MTNRLKKRLFDVLEACRAIMTFTHAKDAAAYERDLLLRSAVERQLEIIGEALKQAAAMEPAVIPSIADLSRIVALRNRIIHGYDSVDDEIVWDIVQT